MLIVFHSRPAAEVLMFSKHALPILQAAGKPYDDALPERGVITHAELAAAIAGIEQMLAVEVEPEFDNEEDEEGEKVHPMEQPVSMRQRVFPLLAMMRAALRHEADISWEPAPVW